MTSSLPGKPLMWIPRGVCDALDGTMAFPGAMSNLQNLIPDPTTRGLWQPRPAAVLRTPVPGAFVSCMLRVGTRIYGMSGSPGGKDSPFCYDMQTQQFVPIMGPLPAHPPGVTVYPPIDQNTLPFSPQTDGPWSPPNMTLVGSQIIVAHPGFVKHNGYFGVIDTTLSFHLTWTSTNTSPTVLIHPPTWVVNFNGRCFFLVNPPGEQPAAYMSDTLNPTVITNANQILTFGDNLTLTVEAGLALNNQLGGIIQSLMVFKGSTNIYQVTGDYALGNLAINSLNVATGTNAPNTVVSSEKGLLFMAPDGIRLIDFNATVSDPIGKSGQGITVPFIQVQVPSRACAGFNVGIYRVQVRNVNTQQEWWYDAVRDLWSGPHTTGLSLIIPYANTFVCTLQNGGAQLFQSDPLQLPISTFVENGIQLLWAWQTVNLPDTDDLCENCCIEATLALQIPPATHQANDPGVVNVSFLDQNAVALDTVTILSGNAATIWGHFNWGQALWLGAVGNLFSQQLAWHWPIVFRRGSVQATGI